MKTTILSANQTLRNISIALMLLTLIGCTKETANPFLLRVENRSPMVLENLVFFSRDVEYSFGDISSGRTSRYQVIESAYITPACTFKVKGIEYNSVVRCATPAPETISAGQYVLRVNSVNGSEADIELIRD